MNRVEKGRNDIDNETHKNVTKLNSKKLWKTAADRHGQWDCTNTENPRLTALTAGRKAQIMGHIRNATEGNTEKDK